jgi:hypothetical protein
VVIRRYASEGHFNSAGDGARGHMGSYHRMLSTYVNDLIRVGFVLERLEEPLDGPANGALFSEVPMVLVIAARAIWAEIAMALKHVRQTRQPRRRSPHALRDPAAAARTPARSTS